MDASYLGVTLPPHLSEVPFAPMFVPIKDLKENSGICTWSYTIPSGLGKKDYIFYARMHMFEWLDRRQIYKREKPIQEFVYKIELPPTEQSIYGRKLAYYLIQKRKTKSKLVPRPTWKI